MNHDQDMITDDESDYEPEYEPEPVASVQPSNVNNLRRSSEIEGNASSETTINLFTPRQIVDPYLILRIEQQRYKDLSPIGYILTIHTPHPRLATPSDHTVCHQDVQCIDTDKEGVFTALYPARLDSGVERVICDWFGSVAIELDLYDRPDYDGSTFLNHGTASAETIETVSKTRRMRTALMELKTILLILTRRNGTSKQASSNLVAKSMGFNNKGPTWMRTGEALLFGCEPHYVFLELRWVREEVRKMCMKVMVEEPTLPMQGNLNALKGGNFYPIAWAEFVSAILTKFVSDVKANMERFCKPDCGLSCISGKRHEPVCEWV